MFQFTWRREHAPQQFQFCKVLSYVTTLIAAFTLFPLVSKAIPPSYTVQDLGPLGATSINASGEVTGFGPEHAFLYNGVEIRDLDIPGSPYSEGWSINASGQVVGQLSYDYKIYHAFLYDGLSTYDLGTLGGSNSQAWGINAAGYVVGYSFLPGDSVRHAFLYDGLKMQDLGTLGGASFPSSVAEAINDAGKIVGYSDTGNFGSHAFLYDGGKMHDLGTLGGGASSYQSSVAEAINNVGQIAGFSDTVNFDTHAFLYDSGKMRDLGTLGGSESRAYGINGNGQVVGFSYTKNGDQHAFVYDSNTIHDLNDFIDGTLGLRLTWAFGINDSGKIVGISTINGETHAFLLTPSSASLTTISNVAALTTSNSAQITWVSPHPADSVVEYGRTTAYGAKVSNRTLVTRHTVALTGLSPATLYHFRVSSKDASGNTLVSKDYTFVTSTPTTGGDGRFSYTITRLLDGRYQVDGMFTYIKRGDFQVMMSHVTMASATLGRVKPATPLPFQIIPFLNPGGSANFSMTFPASAGFSGSTSVMQLRLEYFDGLNDHLPVYGSYRVRLP